MLFADPGSVRSRMQDLYYSEENPYDNTLSVSALADNPTHCFAMLWWSHCFPPFGFNELLQTVLWFARELFPVY